MTKREKEVYEMYKTFHEIMNEYPTLAELTAALGVSSIGSVHRTVLSLEKKGYLKRADGVIWRSFRPVNSKSEYSPKKKKRLSEPQEASNSSTTS